ncbi:MAG: outer membrane lipoprotein-sorting protein [Bacteroidales bacterium]|jgi:outer membrane lipoprotein-sorting protein
MRILSLLSILLISSIASGQPSGKDLMNLIDRNMTANTRILTAKMIISGARESRTVEFNTWAEGEKKAFSEYTNPPREKGTKMLKLEDKLWIYSPSTDRIIQITGQMLRQSVMGSDLSYEDMMEDKALENHYNAAVTGSDTLEKRDCWVLQLDAKTEGEAYEVRKIWVDKERNIPLREELYAKSGKLLKRLRLTDFERIQGRWYPMKMIFKDMLKAGDGTQFIIQKIKLDEPIPEDIFTKASLK